MDEYDTNRGAYRALLNADVERRLLTDADWITSACSWRLRQAGNEPISQITNKAQRKCRRVFSGAFVHFYYTILRYEIYDDSTCTTILQWLRFCACFTRWNVLFYDLKRCLVKAVERLIFIGVLARHFQYPVCVVQPGIIKRQNAVLLLYTAEA